MQLLIPTDIEQTLLAYVKRTYLPERFQRTGEGAPFREKDFRFFAPAVAALSSAFTSERKELPKDYLNRKEYRSAYLLYFFLTNYAKVTHCLMQMESAGKLPADENLRVLDLGSGPGTAATAAARFFSEHHPTTPLTIDLVEQNPHALFDAGHLFPLLAGKDKGLRLHKTRLTPFNMSRVLKGARYQLILAANVLNELGTVKEQYDLIRQLMTDALTDDGLVLIVDPALQKTTRGLMELRDRLLDGGVAKVLAPCLHQGRCPMRAANPRDWCHFYIEWHCPETIRNFDRQIGNKHDYLKMAYFVFAKTGASPGVSPTPLWRVVSSPMPSKGKTEMLLCGESGDLLRVVQLDKDVSCREDALRNIKRGDIVVWPKGKQRMAHGEKLKRSFVWNAPRSHRCANDR